jgi:amidase
MVSKAMQEGVARLQSQGAVIEEVDLGFRASDIDTYALGLFSTSMGHFCLSEADKKPELLTHYFKSVIDQYARSTSNKKLSEAEVLMETLHKKIQNSVFLKGFSSIIMPTMATPYFAADMGKNEEGLMVTINGQKRSAKKWDNAFTWHWNLLGQHPVINLPIGVTPENIPLGMQLIGNTYEDLTIFQVAFNYAKASTQFYENEGMSQKIKKFSKL